MAIDEAAWRRMAVYPLVLLVGAYHGDSEDNEREAEISLIPQKVAYNERECRVVNRPEVDRVEKMKLVRKCSSYCTKRDRGGGILWCEHLCVVARDKSNDGGIQER